MDKTTSKIKGAVSKIGAALSGKAGILNTLEGEHSEVESLMNDVMETQSVEKQRELYVDIRQKLLVHTEGEEQGIYAHCRAHEATRALVEKATQDHKEAKQLMAALDRLEFGGTQWMQKFGALRSSVMAHVQFEEQRLFPTAKDVIDNETLRDLDDRYDRYRQQIKDRGETLEIDLEESMPTV